MGSSVPAADEENGVSKMKHLPLHNKTDGCVDIENNRHSGYGSIETETMHRKVEVKEVDERSTAEEPTYIDLLRTHREFRLYMASYLITHAGEWFTYVASIAVIEHILGPDSTSSRTAISILVVVRLIPYVLTSALGGTLADSRDRLQSMVTLDVMGAIVALLYLAAYQARSIPLIYVVTFLQVCIGGLYEPCRSAIVPMLVPDESYLKKAVTLSGLAWSTMAAAGSGLGGISVAAFGIRACFVLDSLSYLASAFLLYLIGGKWDATERSGSAPRYESVFEQIRSMTVDGVRYLRSSFWGPLVLVKGSGALVFGAADVLNVSFAEKGAVDEDVQSLRIGVIFACVGVGCVLAQMPSPT